ncbi:hypothetical protein OED01_09935 [Microbacterium sp. M28]|uniref:hypothetical protein n=1 Tax=Microbacterium sp. M28 TaxID=2962064 RepID=UPI0021F48C5A|nr:hypothetical protein [Microbacterium sp. M28]UYO95929.1 hypothetical protein OED01_09935 [Microbacterium sp. M28]
MSAEATARRLPHPQSPIREERGPRLRPVEETAPRRRPKLVYALVALAGAVLIGAAQMGLTLATTHDSFVLADLKDQQRSLNLEAQALEEQLAGANSPQSLASKASELGMVVAGSASYLRLSDGTVVGAGTGADWTSSIDPNGAGAVANSLIEDRAAAAAAAGAAEQSAAGDAAAPPESDTPPALTDGLPTPSTH